MKAAELGIDINPEKQSLGQIKVAIYSKLADFIKDQKKLRLALAKSKNKDLKKNNGNPSKNTKKLESELNVQEKLFSINGQSVSGKLSSLGSVLYDGNNLLENSGVGALGVPLLKFEEGKLLSKNITSALPVYIVGNTNSETLYSQLKEDREKQAANDAEFNLAGRSFTSLITNLTKDRDSATGYISHKDTKEMKKLGKIKSNAIKQINEYGNMMASKINSIIDNKSSEADIDAANNNIKLFEQVANNAILKINTANNKNDVDEILNFFNMNDKKTLTLTKIIKKLEDKQLENNSNTTSTSINTPEFAPTQDQIDAALKLLSNSQMSSEVLSDLIPNSNSILSKLNSSINASSIGNLSAELENTDQSSPNWGKQKKLGDFIYYNTASKKMLKSFGINRTEVQPVFITNGFTEYLNNNVEKGFQDVINASHSIYGYLSSTLPILFGGLQAVGLTVNAASATALTAGMKEAIMSAAETMLIPFESMKATNIYKYATGGSGQAQNAKVNYSQFITGDSKTGKVNPELVTVDWNKKQFDVKPANNDGNTVTNKTTMTTKERSSSFNVKFTEGTIHYHKTGETDEGDNIALKVYPVTPGINDKVNINGENVSIMDLMVGMYSSLSSIESLMGTNVELTKVIAAKPVSQVKSSGEAPVSESTFPTNLDGILRGE